MGLMRFICALRRPEEYLKISQMERGNKHLRERRVANHKLAMEAIHLAQQGHTVELYCTESDKMELRSTPSPGKAIFNGKTIEINPSR